MTDETTRYLALRARLLAASWGIIHHEEPYEPMRHFVALRVVEPGKAGFASYMGESPSSAYEAALLAVSEAAKDGHALPQLHEQEV